VRTTGTYGVPSLVGDTSLGAESFGVNAKTPAFRPGRCSDVRVKVSNHLDEKVDVIPSVRLAGAFRDYRKRADKVIVIQHPVYLSLSPPLIADGQLSHRKRKSASHYPRPPVTIRGKLAEINPAGFA